MSGQVLEVSSRSQGEKNVLTPTNKAETPASGPDKGWAWVVAFACFAINFILGGIARSSAVLYVALIDLYRVSREAATTPFSTRVCVRNLSGPVVGMLGQKFGIRAVTLAGGLLAGCGGIMCYFAPSVIWITVFWGGLSGIGYGLSTILHMMMINEYFDKYKGTAIGLGYSGDCIGTFVLPVIMELLIATYGVQPAFLLTGAIVLNVVPMAMLLKPAPWTKAGKKTGRIQGHANDGFVDSEVTNHMQPLANETARNKDSATNNGTNGDVYTVSKTFPRISKRNYTEYAASTLFDRAEISNDNRNGGKTLGNETFNDITKCDILYRNIQPAKISECTYDAGNDSKKDVESTKHSLPQRKQLQVPAVGITDYCHLAKQFDNITEIHIENINRTGSNISNRSELTATITDNPSVSEMHIRIRAHSETLRDSTNGGSSATIGRQDGNASVSRLGKPFKSSEVAETYQKQTGFISGPDTGGRLGAAAMKALKKMCYTNKKPIYVLICTTCSVHRLLFVSLTTVIIDFVLDEGVSESNGKYLVIGLSAADFAGRLGFGFVIDKGWIAMKNYVVLTMTVMGSVVALLPFAETFLLLMLGISLYGFTQGGAAIVYPILIEKYMEKDERSIAMGCFNFYAGVLMFAMAPMIGFFRDKYGSYDGMLYIDGVMTLVVGLVWFF